jgi:hypothetical protein
MAAMNSVVPFKVESGLNLPTSLARPLVRFTWEPGVVSPFSLTLWYSDGSGIQITNEMHNTSPRSEAGALCFRRVQTPSAKEHNVSLEKPRQINRVEKLTICEKGHTVECGIKLFGSDTAPIIVCAGAFPCDVFFCGPELPPPQDKPEYPLDQYARNEWA